MFKGAFAKRGLAPVVLSRTVGDSGDRHRRALIPWNSCGAYMAATLGVATCSYAPFAVFSSLSPLLTVAIAYAGHPHGAGRHARRAGRARGMSAHRWSR